MNPWAQLEHLSGVHRRGKRNKASRELQGLRDRRVEEVGKRNQESLHQQGRSSKDLEPLVPRNSMVLQGSHSGCGLGSVGIAREHLVVRAASQSLAAVD